MACLDSDILVALLRGDDGAVEKISVLESSGPVSTTPVNATELFKGAYRSEQWKENVVQVKELLSNIRLLTYDIESARIAAQIMESLRKDGQNIGDMDCIIAGMAVSHGETLITRNTKHFKLIPELKIEKW